MRLQRVLTTDFLCINNKLEREVSKISFRIRWYIDALYYNEMFYSVACWNNDAAVDREMKNMNSKSYKLLALKDNISMRVICLGWGDLSTHCYKNG